MSISESVSFLNVSKTVSHSWKLKDVWNFKFSSLFFAVVISFKVTVSFLSIVFLLFLSKNNRSCLDLWSNITAVTSGGICFKRTEEKLMENCVLISADHGYPSMWFLFGWELSVPTHALIWVYNCCMWVSVFHPVCNPYMHGCGCMWVTYIQ